MYVCNLLTPYLFVINISLFYLQHILLQCICDILFENLSLYHIPYFLTISLYKVDINTYSKKHYP